MTAATSWRGPFMEQLRASGELLEYKKELLEQAPSEYGPQAIVDYSPTGGNSFSGAPPFRGYEDTAMRRKIVPRSSRNLSPGACQRCCLCWQTIAGAWGDSDAAASVGLHPTAAMGGRP